MLSRLSENVNFNRREIFLAANYFCRSTLWVTSWLTSLTSDILHLKELDACALRLKPSSHFSTLWGFLKHKFTKLLPLTRQKPFGTHAVLRNLTSSVYGGAQTRNAILFIPHFLCVSAKTSLRGFYSCTAACFLWQRSKYRC